MVKFFVAVFFAFVLSTTPSFAGGMTPGNPGTGGNGGISPGNPGTGGFGFGGTGNGGRGGVSPGNPGTLGGFGFAGERGGVTPSNPGTGGFGGKSFQGTFGHTVGDGASGYLRLYR